VIAAAITEAITVVHVTLARAAYPPLHRRL
jgi:hypothetical protein